MNLSSVMAWGFGSLAEAATTQKTDPPGLVTFLQNPMILLLLGVAVMYFFIIRSKTRGERARKDMLGQLKRGDRVQTIGGILGTVVEARETEVVLKVDEGTNTKMKFTRSAIHQVLGEEKEKDSK